MEESETNNGAGAVVPETVLSSGQELKAAREAARLTLADLAQRTRVPQRHLEALEEGRFEALPSITYCAGFSRAYARAVGLDERAIVAKVRGEVEAQGLVGQERYVPEEPVSSNSVPPRYLAWTTAVLALLIAGGYGIWRMQLNTQPAGEEIAAASRAETRVTTPDNSAAPAAPAAAGPVVLTAVDEVWLRIYDADGKRLFEKAMAKGESYTVPADANNPMILTGRPDALAVTVGGQAVPPLGTAERTIADVPISGAALLARGKPADPAAIAPGTGNSAAPLAPGAASGAMPAPLAAPAPIAPTGTPR